MDKDALISEYEEDIRTYKARIAELEAQCKLVQVDEDEDLHDPINVGGEIHTMYSGTAFILVGYETEADCIHLPPGYCIAKTASQTAIRCCICSKPIEGDDLANRFWLHEKGCQFGHTGLCECDLECHAECYAGHEHEYAPPFDDEDDE